MKYVKETVGDTTTVEFECSVTGFILLPILIIVVSFNESYVNDTRLVEYLGYWVIGMISITVCYFSVKFFDLID